MNLQNVTSVVLCAGKGTRIELGDNTPKCVRNIGGKPMITYTVNTLKSLGVKDIIVVIAPDDKTIKDILGSNVKYVEQKNPKGNAHATLQAKSQVKTKYVHIVQGDDSAFYTKETLQDYISKSIQQKAVISCVTAEKPEQKNWGRIVRGDNGGFVSIVEKEDLTPNQAQITEVNSGMYFGHSAWIFDAIENLPPSNVGKGEIVLPDLLKTGVGAGEKVYAYKLDNPNENIGVNDIKEWEHADSMMWLRLKKLPVVCEELKQINLKKPIVFWDLNGTLLCVKTLNEEILGKVRELSGGSLGNNKSVLNRFDKKFFNYRLFLSYIADRTGLKSPFVASEINKVIKSSKKHVILKTAKVLENSDFNHILITRGDIYLQKMKLEHSGLKKYFKRIYYTQVNKDFLFYTDFIESEILNAPNVIVVNDNKRENQAFTSLLQAATLYESEDIIGGKLEVS